ncbi:aminopeptidase P family protein [Aquibium carbonis]|uniref:Aminopeptidase P family protein n=1 Tax=Aquibium carbonis TaxID=2495581 RepID=A0A3S0G4Z7_9HYPH|nr:Xaa-Pro peptidase family protein [Aquibium carbonis]RST83914.1 aminopeptidase P family protein [Aquibium carbonis]
MENATSPISTPQLPFDAGLLDALMEEAGLDVLVLTSKHNVQYMLGGYRFFMFDTMDAIGLSRYLPILVYPRGAPDKAAYIANPNERYEQEIRDFWPATIVAKARGTTDAMALCIDHLRGIGADRGRIGVEAGFLPADAWALMSRELGSVPPRDCVEVMETLRMIKTPAELELLRSASERIERSMLETFASIRPGQTKGQITETLRQREVAHGLVFEYCLITVGGSLNRAPSAEIIQEGDILSLDSGGNLGGYIGDICRMGILGKPPAAELVEALAEIEAIQQAARRPVQPGRLGADIFEAVAALVEIPREGTLSFVAHGMGLVSHEAPRLMADGPIPYPAPHRDRPLVAGMVLSIETTWQHPRLGFLKLEDTVAVTETGWEAFGDGHRGWNRAGA